jgi:hypothetical protein
VKTGDGDQLTMKNLHLASQFSHLEKSHEEISPPVGCGAAGPLGLARSGNVEE